MALIYITGMPSSGKSTIREKLLQKGFTTYGGAEDKLAAFYIIKLMIGLSGSEQKIALPNGINSILGKSREKQLKN